MGQHVDQWPHLLVSAGVEHRCQASHTARVYRLEINDTAVCLTDQDLGGKGKKKGVVLSPAQAEALSAVTSCLKVLTVNAGCAYQLARSGCIGVLVKVMECRHLVARRGARTILGIPSDSSLSAWVSRTTHTKATISRRQQSYIERGLSSCVYVYYGMERDVLACFLGCCDPNCCHTDPITCSMRNAEGVLQVTLL
jgi:hypothetical protein